MPRQYLASQHPRTIYVNVSALQFDDVIALFLQVTGMCQLFPFAVGIVVHKHMRDDHAIALVRVRVRWCKLLAVLLFSCRPAPPPLFQLSIIFFFHSPFYADVRALAYVGGSFPALRVHAWADDCCDSVGRRWRWRWLWRRWWCLSSLFQCWVPAVLNWLMPDWRLGGWYVLRHHEKSSTTPFNN